MTLSKMINTGICRARAIEKAYALSSGDGGGGVKVRLGS